MNPGAGALSSADSTAHETNLTRRTLSGGVVGNSYEAFLAGFGPGTSRRALEERRVLQPEQPGHDSVEPLPILVDIAAGASDPSLPPMLIAATSIVNVLLSSHCLTSSDFLRLDLVTCRQETAAALACIQIRMFECEN
jgi:hypothetical protein